MAEQWEDHRLILKVLKNSDFIAVDTESAGFSGRILGISVAVNDILGMYFPIGHSYNDNCPDDIIEELKEIIETHPCIAFHNAKHDTRVLEKAGFKYNPNHICTMVMFHMLHENEFSKSLDYTSKYYGGKPKERPEAMQKVIDNYGWTALPAWLTKEYAEHDAKITAGVVPQIRAEFAAEYKPDLWEVEKDFMRVIQGIENVGIKIDRELSQEQALIGREVMEEIEEDLGWNPGSTKQLGEYLIDTLHLPVFRTTPKGKPSFDKKALEDYDIALELLQNPTAKKVLRYRGWQKTVTSNYESYLLLADEDDILHPNFKIHGTVTGRLSCEKPNLQQIPRHTEKEWNGNLKAAFIPRPGKYLLDVDYSQLEFRLAAAYAKEEALIEVFREGRDVFSEMASQLGWDRYDCKTFTYATLYGGGVTRISNLFGVSMDDARDMREQFFSEYRNLRKVSNLAMNLCKQDRYIEYWTGRRRHFDNPREDAHKAFNSLIQGGAFEIVKRAMVRLTKSLPRATMVLQVHDSVVFEIDEGVDWTDEICHLMTDVPEDFGVPFVVEAKIWGS